MQEKTKMIHQWGERKKNDSGAHLGTEYKKTDDKSAISSYHGSHVGDAKRESTTVLFDKRIWRIDDVAQFLGCSVGHIYNLSSDEKIPKIKKGKFLFFIPNEILEWVLKGDC